MSLLFDGEQVQEQPTWIEPSLADHEAALEDLRTGLPGSDAGTRLRSFTRAEALYRAARQVEPVLLVAIASGEVSSVAEGVAYVQARTPAWFPAARMIEIMITRAGGTPALLRAAAIREVGGG